MASTGPGRASATRGDATPRSGDPEVAQQRRQLLRPTLFGDPEDAVEGHPYGDPGARRNPEGRDGAAGSSFEPGEEGAARKR